MLKVTVLRSEKTYNDVKKACMEFADNPKVFDNVDAKKKQEKKKSEDDIEDVSRQLADMNIMLAKQQRAFKNMVAGTNN